MRGFNVGALQLYKEISETMNQSQHLDTMLQEVLKKLVELTQLDTGWIFFNDDVHRYRLVAEYQLPPALTRNDRTLMKHGSCACLDTYWNEGLNSAKNIISCHRLNQAVRKNWGDTCGIEYHATIPLYAGERSLGLMNVAAADKKQFTSEELTTLQSVAYQIGMAVERTRLFQSERKRANLLHQLGEVTRNLKGLTNVDDIHAPVVQWLGERFECETAALLLEGENDAFYRRSLYAEPGRSEPVWNERERHLMKKAHQVGKAQALVGSGAVRPMDDLNDADATSLAAPLFLHDEAFGVLYVRSQSGAFFDTTDMEIVELLADHASLAYEHAYLYQQQVALSKREERQRLAQDLHDSVSQALFSLQFTSRGLKRMMTDSNPMVKEAVEDIQHLSQNALAEMRSLILQLRPPGLENGLLTSLYRYGKQMGLVVTHRADEILEWPPRVEETLYRIGQEALNNVYKHADTDQLTIDLKKESATVTMTITDFGRGFSPHKGLEASGMGMKTMRERAEALAGTFSLNSSDQGTTIRVTLPLRDEKEDERA